MSEISPNLAPVAAPRRTIIFAVILGLALALLAALFALVMAVAALALFNGCLGTSSAVGETLMMAWIFVLWPLAAVGAGLAPALMLGRGRGWKKALQALGAGSLIAVIVYVGWLLVGSVLFC